MCSGRPFTRSSGSGIALALVGTLLSGCELPGARPAPAADVSAPPPVLRRQQAFYPGLTSGRFISLADFESPEQVELFRVLWSDGLEGGLTQPSLSIRRARNETGAGSLKFQLTTSKQLVADGQHSEILGLPSDWRPYGLLLMSIHAPENTGAIQVGVESDQPPLAWQQSYPLRPGWNLIQIDTASVGDEVNIADVRRITWQLPTDTPRGEFYLDDIILADNTEPIIDRDPTRGALYAFKRGRRIHVGATDRFELAWADGAIVHWTGPDGVNLADPRGLGPWPVQLNDDWQAPTTQPVRYDDPAPYRYWGSAVVARQTIVEASPLRVIVESQWRFVTPGDAPDETRLHNAPGHTWRFTVYPTGAVHVHAVSRSPAEGWGLPLVGYAVGLDGRRDFACETVARSTDEATGPFVHARRTRPGAADLVWVSVPPLPRQQELATVDDRRVALLAGAQPAAPRVETAHLLRIWPTDLDGRPEALSIATDFRQPAAVRITTGQRVTNVPGDLDHDGFNEATGCYEFAAEAGVLRFTLDPQDRLRFNPVCRIQGIDGPRCWAYARGRLIETHGRDANNNVLLALGEVLAAETLVEVYAEPAPAPAPAP